MSINSLKKLCNHPSLLFEGGKPEKGFESCLSLFPPDSFTCRRGSAPPLNPSLSGKFHVLHKMLKLIRRTTDDKVVRGREGGGKAEEEEKKAE